MQGKKSHVTRMLHIVSGESAGGTMRLALRQSAKSLGIEIPPTILDDEAIE